MSILCVEERDLHAVLQEFEDIISTARNLTHVHIARLKHICESAQARCEQQPDGQLETPLHSTSDSAQQCHAGHTQPEVRDSSSTIDKGRCQPAQTSDQIMTRPCGMETQQRSVVAKPSDSSHPGHSMAPEDHSKTGAVLHALERRKSTIEDQAGRALEQVQFDESCEDVRFTHILYDVRTGNEPYLRVMAARSLALQLKAWEQAQPDYGSIIGVPDKSGRRCDGKIGAFINEISKQTTAKPYYRHVQTHINVGNKLLKLEEVLNNRGLSIAMRYVWEALRRLPFGDIPELAIKLKSHWSNQCAQKHEASVIDSFRLYEGQRPDQHSLRNLTFVQRSGSVGNAHTQRRTRASLVSGLDWVKMTAVEASSCRPHTMRARPHVLGRRSKHKCLLIAGATSATQLD